MAANRLAAAQLSIGSRTEWRAHCGIRLPSQAVSMLKRAHGCLCMKSLLPIKAEKEISTVGGEGESLEYFVWARDLYRLCATLPLEGIESFLVRRHAAEDTTTGFGRVNRPAQLDVDRSARSCFRSHPVLVPSSI